MEKQKYNVITIPNEAIVEFKIAGAFYNRLNKTLMDYAANSSKEQLLMAVDLIKRDKAEKSDFAFNLETLIILVRDIEKAYQAAGLTVTEEIEIEIPDKKTEG